MQSTRDRIRVLRARWKRARRMIRVMRDGGDIGQMALLDAVNHAMDCKRAYLYALFVAELSAHLRGKSHRHGMSL